MEQMERLGLKQWQEDEDVTHCSQAECPKAFGMLTRKHHCRFCGRIACDECTKERVLHPQTQTVERMCRECSLRRSQADPNSMSFNSLLIPTSELTESESDETPTYTSDGRACRYGAACHSFGCKFQHPPGRVPECRHGVNCHARGCTYLHPGTRDRRNSTRGAAGERPNTARTNQEIKNPWHWKGATGKPQELVQVTDEKELSAVTDRLRKGFDHHEDCTVNIISVERNQNAYVWGSYVMERNKISDRKGDVNERWLWHGLNPEVLQAVLADGFNINFASLENNVYGVGSPMPTRSSI